jgi:hypothetical protein
LTTRPSRPRNYRNLLESFRARELPLICANPDRVVERGDRLVPCAGALADLYADLGGETRIAGKPHAPIYREALARAEASAAKWIRPGPGNRRRCPPISAARSTMALKRSSSPVESTPAIILTAGPPTRPAAGLPGCEEGLAPAYWMEWLA